MIYVFGENPVVQEYRSVPPGTYRCRVAEVRPGETREGHVRWGIKLVISEGPETGRFGAWDGLVFSPRAEMRTRQVLAAFGLPHSGRVELSPSDLLGREVYVTLVEELWKDPRSGVETLRNRVPFGGIRPVDRGREDRKGEGSPEEEREAADGTL